MIKVALKGLAGRKLRAALTALAIVLGVAMVSGTFKRTMVSSSPAVKPKLPSPITETHLALGRP